MQNMYDRVGVLTVDQSNEGSIAATSGLTSTGWYRGYLLVVDTLEKHPLRSFPLSSNSPEFWYISPERTNEVKVRKRHARWLMRRRSRGGRKPKSHSLLMGVRTQLSLCVRPKNSFSLLASILASLWLDRSAKC